MRNTCIFPCIMRMISNVSIFFFLSSTYFQIFIYKYNRFLPLDIIHTALLLIVFFFFLKLIIFIACSLKYSQNFFMEFWLLHKSCSFYMLQNDDIVDIEKHDRVSSLTFLVDEFPGLFFYPSIFRIIHSRSA